MSVAEEPHLKSNNFKRGVRSAFLPVTLGCLVLISLLAGCQIQDLLLPTATLTTAPTDLLAANSTPEPNATLAVVTPSVAQTQLVIWVPPQFDPGLDTQAAALLSQRLDAFESIHPDVTVEVRVKTVEGRGGLLDSLSAASSAAPKALPALILLSSEDLENAALKDILLPLDSFYKNFNDPDWLPYASQLSLVQDTRYGVPLAGDALVMAYRPLQSPFPPTTWQELSLQDQPVAFPAADEDALTILSMYLASGGKLTDAAGAPLLQKSALLKSYAIINDGTQTGVFPFWLSQFTGFDQSWLAFQNQQAGYSINWVSQYLADRPDNTSIALVPKMGSVQVTLARGWLWCIPSQYTNQPYSVELLNYLSEKDFVNQLGFEAGFVPLRQSGLDAWQNAPEAAVISELVHNAQNLPPAHITQSLNPILESSLVQVIKKQVYYQQTVEEAVKNFNQ
jgi:ABC-type glycerol-3-phosphate transport system substrate-binding protein